LQVQIVTADLKDPSTLGPACIGATTVISGATAVIPRAPGDSINAVDRDGHLALIDAAATAGVRHFVFVSYSGNLDTQSPLTEAKRTVERHLRESGTGFTILRPTFFMETWLSPVVGFDLAARHVRIFGDGNAPVSWVALGDVAAVAAACADSPAARDATIEFGGPDPLTPLQVVAMAQDIGGAAIDVEHVSVPDLQAQRTAARTDTEAAFAALMIDLADGDPMPASVPNGVPVPQATVRDYVGKVAWE
jgi:NADH dehydrogenase